MRNCSFHWGTLFKMHPIQYFQSSLVFPLATVTLYSAGSYTLPRFSLGMTIAVVIPVGPTTNFCLSECF